LLITTLSLLAGFILLLGGGEYLVRGAGAIALRFGLSHLVVGIVIVGFGTSVPELVASVQAAMAGAPGIAMGNVVVPTLPTSCSFSGQEQSSTRSLFPSTLSIAMA
jgi:Ca2+/Na+ antiporter